MANDREAKEILGTAGDTAPAGQEVIDPQQLDLREEVIHLNRVAKVVKGGRRFSFSALVAVGNEDGIVGIGYGKAREVPLCISKAVENAKNSLFRVWRRGTSVSYKVIGSYGGANVMLKPASKGTGIIAGTAVRTVCELAGVNDILTKSLGSDNVINVVKATAEGLGQLRNPQEVAELRGKTLEELLGKKRAQEIREQERRPGVPTAEEAAAEQTEQSAPDAEGATAIPDAEPVAAAGADAPAGEAAVANETAPAPPKPAGDTAPQA